MVQHRVHKYKHDLMLEINADREEQGKKPFDDDDPGEEDGDKSEPAREVKESSTDPESGLFYKREKECRFAYSVSVACDQNNFILA